MNSGYRFFVYVLILLMAVAAVGFLVFQDPILESRSPSRDLGAWAAGLAVTAQAGPSADILKHAALTALTDYSPTFDFDKICASGHCAPGNALPFRTPPPPEEGQNNEPSN